MNEWMNEWMNDLSRQQHDEMQTSKLAMRHWAIYGSV